MGRHPARAWDKMYSQRVDAQMAPTAGSAGSRFAPPVDRKGALQVPEAAGTDTNRPFCGLCHTLTKATEKRLEWNMHDSH